MGRGFDPSASWVPAQLRKPVKEALDSGWTPGNDRIKAGGWFIYSPKRSEKFYVPITCKDPDNVAKKLRALISRAYLNEKNAFEPDVPRDFKAEVNSLADAAEVLVGKGARIIPGPVPQIECPVCDGGFPSWEAFANHQEACLAADAAAHEAEQEQVVPEEGDEADRPSEGDSQSVPVSTEPAQSGTIGTKEETPLASESTDTPTPDTKKRARKGGYTWTHVEEPLHRLLYEAIKYTRRWKNETDSKWAKRLAQYIDEEGLLNTLVFEVDADAQATHVLDQIRELVGIDVEPGGPSEEEIEQYKTDIAEKDAKILALGEKVTELRGVLNTLSDLAKETDK